MATTMQCTELVCMYWVPEAGEGFSRDALVVGREGRASWYVDEDGENREDGDVTEDYDWRHGGRALKLVTILGLWVDARDEDSA